MTYTKEVAIVTGGAGFIGSAICAALAKDGARVVIGDLDQSKIEERLDALRTIGVPAVGTVCDVRRVADAEAIVQQAYREFGRADFLVNTAAIWPVAAFLDVTYEQWAAVLETNLTSIFVLCQVFARAAVAHHEPAKIVNITSGASRVVRPGMAAYSTSKAGLEALTRAMAIELAPHRIHVHAVNPGLTETDYNSRVERERPDVHRTKMAKIPFGRMSRPEEAAALVAFLLSPAASYMTGCVIDSDGGYTLGIPRYS
jgi:NAD(P)-dependent dehydrogenase (short-subunit alcohol dehydrogenase family)